VGVAPYPTHRSSLNFTDPNSFIPDRWIEPRKGDDLRAVQIFSVGPRNCVGRTLAIAEMRLILARLLWQFDLKLVEDNWSIEDQKIFFLWKKPALRVVLQEREFEKI
jgi:cytochrome P450